MESKDLIQKIEEIEKILSKDSSDWSNPSCHSFYITVVQFVRTYVGKESEFYLILFDFNRQSTAPGEKASVAFEVLKALKDYLKLDLELNQSEKYKIRTDVISDFMEQAIYLASDKKFHPAAAGILMGAALEEFLKKLLEENNIDVDGVKLTIDPIKSKLYAEKLITKQDLKDITSWAGIRNEATHGNFDEVNDRKRILNAIEGVNLFMRKYNN